METKHTPAPWFYSFEAEDENKHFAITLNKDGSGYLGADHTKESNYLRMSGICREADAKLMAAAPDLLAACKTAIRLKQLWTIGENVDANVGEQYAEELNALTNLELQLIEAIKKATE